MSLSRKPPTKTKPPQRHRVRGLVTISVASRNRNARLNGNLRLDYSKYRRVLRQYCEEAGVRIIASHGLRHSSSEIWMDAGASRDDIRILFAHQDGKTTDLYVHDRGNRLTKVADGLKLFPTRSVAQ